MKGQDWNPVRRQEGGDCVPDWGGGSGGGRIQEMCWIISGCVAWVVRREVVAP